MIGVPERNEAAPYYFTYIDKVSSNDIVRRMEEQLPETLAMLRGISEQKSLHRYAPDKWSIREVLGHVNDCERMFCFRALWFARGFETPLPSFEQEIAAANAPGDKIPWAEHVAEFERIRGATISLFRNLPPEAWKKTGVASGNTFTVRALAFITAGHVEHHLEIVRERYF